jgi:hypothetical protein
MGLRREANQVVRLILRDSSTGAEVEIPSTEVMIHHEQYEIPNTFYEDVDVPMVRRFEQKLTIEADFFNMGEYMSRAKEDAQKEVETYPEICMTPQCENRSPGGWYCKKEPNHEGKHRVWDDFDPTEYEEWS